MTKTHSERCDCGAKTVRAAQELRIAEGHAPDGYAVALAEQHTVGRSLADFEREYREDRAAEFAGDHLATAKDPITFETLSEDDLARFKPPDPYAAAIKALRESERR